MDAHGHFARWMYRSGHPNHLARTLNGMWAHAFSLGVLPGWATLEVRGRSSGRPIAVPLAVVREDGERYLVSMLGERANWVRNVRAAQGRAVLRHGRRRAVRLVEVPVAERTPVLRRYLAQAPGGRPHLPVGPDASDQALAEVAPSVPVFRITPA